MKLCGYAGAILHVDLSSRAVRTETLTEEMARGYIGCLGINTKLAYDAIPPGADALSPENCLIFGTGPLGATLVPACSRSEVTGKSPLTNLFGSANAGESVALMAKLAGYDHVVITGKSDRPASLIISDDRVEIRDAEHLWGKDTWEATDRLWDEVPDHWVTVIGPAGENLVRCAAMVSNKQSVHARTGMGAVMGSKNLKAIAAKGTRGVEVADPKGFMKIVPVILDRFRTAASVPMWRELGFVVAFPAYGANGLFERLNYSQGYPELSQAFTKEEFQKRLKKRGYACPSCPVGCKDWLALEDGPYAGLRLQVAAMGSQVGYHSQPGVDTWDDVAKLAELENRYGIDSTSACGSIAFAIELYKRGLLTKEQTGGLELDWGAETYRTLLEKMVRREGLGAALAEGTKAAAARFGAEAQKFASHVKGVDLGLGLRGRLSTENFGQLTNPRGGHLDRSPSLTFIPRKPATFPPYCASIGVPADRVPKICEGEEGFNVARLTKWVEDYNTVLTSLGMCHRTPVTQSFNLDAACELYTLTTGIQITPSELRLSGERIWNLQRAFNQREGAGREDDLPPKRVLEEPLTIGDEVHPPLSREKADALLDQYYEERGWNRDGTLAPQKLRELGLSP